MLYFVLWYHCHPSVSYLHVKGSLSKLITRIQSNPGFGPARLGLKDKHDPEIERGMLRAVTKDCAL
jgi:hypothetical protein